MSFTNELDEENWSNGNYFSFLFAENALPLSTTRNLVMVVGEDDIALVGIKITGNGPSLSWRWYKNTVITESTGTELTIVPLNETVLSTSDTKLILDPTITDQGQSLSGSDIEAVGVSATASSYRISENLITKKLALKKNTTHSLTIRNNDTFARNAEVTLIFYKIPPRSSTKSY